MASHSRWTSESARQSPLARRLAAMGARERTVHIDADLFSRGMGFKNKNVLYTELSMLAALGVLKRDADGSCVISVRLT